ncbi:hypothetical protein EMIT0111MI5_80064 [Burkholderia sp. IT-111MI5]
MQPPDERHYPSCVERIRQLTHQHHFINPSKIHQTWGFPDTGCAVVMASLREVTGPPFFDGMNRSEAAHAPEYSGSTAS